MWVGTVPLRASAVTRGSSIEVYPAADFPATTSSDSMVLEMAMTALPVINAIPRLCRARPGIVTYLDLPLVASRGWVPTH